MTAADRRRWRSSFHVRPTIRTRCNSSVTAAPLVPRLGPVHDLDHQQHHGNLDQHADHRRERRAGLEAEQADGRRHGELEEVARADERRGTGDECFSPSRG